MPGTKLEIVSQSQWRQIEADFPSPPSPDPHPEIPRAARTPGILRSDPDFTGSEYSVESYSFVLFAAERAGL